ncbi:MAG: hypothetical protein MK214_14640 [Thalassotalea sp.]|nr:hypothetical protein [Thalassotalea sp.]
MQDHQWQELLRQGNDCFHEQRWNQAEFYYSEAYDLLAFSYRANPLCSQTLMAWICSCHNLSSLYEEMSNIDLALRFVMAPHEYLLEVSNSSVDNEDVKLIAFKGLSLTLPAVMSFAQKYPICEDCLQKFTSLQQLMDHEEKSIH